MSEGGCRIGREPDAPISPHKGDFSRVVDGYFYHFFQIFRKEGPLAFWTGFGAYYGRCAPHAMVILLTVDEYTKMYASFFKEA